MLRLRWPLLLSGSQAYLRIDSPSPALLPSRRRDRWYWMPLSSFPAFLKNVSTSPTQGDPSFESSALF
ncbi:hypothetical protein OPV22_009006 [Ensete ventricosum]|uniref:Secreted protein n=1 Tax=Ensete ventricosum TaxID=4639 RepID=A0AAV8R9R6_ENSVE|nr:hypothetical protein OPV22_009006 [Ensete ventricosum]